MSVRRDIEAWGPLGKPPDVVIRCGRGRVWSKWIALSKEAKMVHGTLSEKKKKSDEISQRKQEIIKMAEGEMKGKQ